MLLRFSIKKRDCTVAVPLLKALALPIVPNKQHRSPRRYVCTRARLLFSVHGYRYTHPEDIKMLQCVGTMFEFTRFQVTKHKAPMTPLLCLQPSHPKDIIPRRGLITGAKIVNYFGLSKSSANKNAIYADFA